VTDTPLAHGQQVRVVGRRGRVLQVAPFEPGTRDARAPDRKPANGP